MNISAIIFCRMGSQRLKAKATQKINNLTLLENVIENTKKIKGLKKIILATTNRKRDDILVKIAKKKKLLTFRGSEKDVLCRTLDCIKKFNIKYFLRVCADRIFFDHEEISKVLFKYKKNIQNYDFISNNKPKVDPGLTIEIVSSSALKRVSKDKFKRKLSVEHITKAFYNYNKDFNIHFIRSPNYFYQGLKYTIDQKKDLDRSNFIFDKLQKNINFLDVMKYTKKWYGK